MLTDPYHADFTEQAGTPMAVTGEDSLPPWLEAGRHGPAFICSQISRGSGGSAPGAVGSAGGWV